MFAGKTASCAASFFIFFLVIAITVVRTSFFSQQLIDLRPILVKEQPFAALFKVLRPFIIFTY